MEENVETAVAVRQSDRPSSFNRLPDRGYVRLRHFLTSSPPILNYVLTKGVDLHWSNPAKRLRYKSGVLEGRSVPTHLEAVHNTTRDIIR
jgi:hypothetical protein